MEPDPKRCGLRARDAERPARVALGELESSRRNVRDGEMRRVDLVRTPAGNLGSDGHRSRCERDAEERELEAEILASAGVQLSGPIPPFVAKLGMRTEVGGKDEGPRLARLRKLRLLRAAAQDRKPVRRNGRPGTLS